MKLLPITDATGKPLFWINADHLVSVQRLDFETGESVQLRAELKVEGMPLQRVELGTFPTSDSADLAWSDFLGRLEQR